MSTYAFINTELEAEHKVHIAYLKLVCLTCGHSWGIPRPEKGAELTQRQITCEECLYRERNNL